MDTIDEQEVEGEVLHRKRVNRIKMAIITLICILTIVPSVMCVILAFNYIKVQRQLDDIMKAEALETEEPSIQTGLFTDDTMITEDDKINSDNKEELSNTNELDMDETDTNGNDTPTGDTITDMNNDEPAIGETEAAKNEAGNGDFEAGQAVIANEQTENNEKETTTQDSGNLDEKTGNEEQPEKAKEIVGTGEYKDKKVYLTFDDGPSIFTDTILDILNEYNVKATFFVTGHENDNAKRLYQRIVDEGHSLGIHSYSHQYSQIYKSIEDFDKDFTKLWNLLYDTIGYKCTIYRFPGGSANKVAKIDIKDIIKYLNDKNITYYDWNVVNGDATGEILTAEELANNVLDGVKVKKNAIVLMHDLETKENTVKSLTTILDELTSKSAQILPIDETTMLIQQVRADKAK